MGTIVKHRLAQADDALFCTITFILINANPINVNRKCSNTSVRSQCKNWLHLFEITNLYDEIYKWFNILITKGNEIEAFVIMPNHLHLLIFVNETNNINMRWQMENI